MDFLIALEDGDMIRQSDYKALYAPKKKLKGVVSLKRKGFNRELYNWQISTVNGEPVFYHQGNKIPENSNLYKQLLKQIK